VEELDRAQKRALRKLFSSALTRLANEALAEVTAFLQRSSFPRASVETDMYHTLLPLGGLPELTAQPQPGDQPHGGPHGAASVLGDLDDIPRLLQERVKLRDDLRELKVRLEAALDSAVGEPAPPV